MAEINSRYGLHFQIIDGLKVPAPFSPDLYQSASHYKPRPDDVFIVTYPKCGTTWAQNIMALIYNQGEPLPSPDKFFAVTPYMELVGAETVANMPRPGTIKIHLPFRLAPWSDVAKYIYITRNPKDCCVSFYHHMKDTPLHGYNGTFDQFFEMFLSGDIEFGDYFDHIMGWYERRNDPNVLFLTYESMKEDHEGTILRMASFVDDEKYALPLRQNRETLDKVLRYSSFEYMREVGNKQLEMMASMSIEDFQNSSFPDAFKQVMGDMLKQMQSLPQQGPATFIRKGVVGDWRNYFSKDQSDRLDEKFRERTRGTEIATWWKDCMEFEQK